MKVALAQINTTVGDVETAYWTLGLAQELEETARRSLDRARQLLRRDSQLLDLELLAAAEVVTARQGVAARRTLLTDAIRRREDAAELLIFLVFGADASAQLRAQGIQIKIVPPADEPPDLPALEQIEAKAITVRHDIRAVAYDLEDALVTLRVAENDLLPELDVVGGYTALTQNTDAFHLFAPGRLGGVQFDGFKAGVVFTYPLRNNLAEARFAQATLDRDRQTIALETAENSVRSEARAAARAVTAGVEELEMANESLRLARQRYVNGQEQLKLGLIDSFHLLLVEDDVSEAGVAEVRARYQLANAITLYELAVGDVENRYVSGGAAAVSRQ